MTNLVVFPGLDGREVYIAPSQVASLTRFKTHSRLTLANALVLELDADVDTILEALRDAAQTDVDLTMPEVLDIEGLLETLKSDIDRIGGETKTGVLKSGTDAIDGIVKVAQEARQAIAKEEPAALSAILKRLSDLEELATAKPAAPESKTK